MLARRWRAFWQRRNFSIKTVIRLFLCNTEYSRLHSFLSLCRFVSHIETNVTKCNDKVNSEAFYVIYLDVCQRNQ